MNWKVEPRSAFGVATKIGDERLWSRLFPATPACDPSVSFNHKLCFIDGRTITLLRTTSN
jgi:hypothetical protein